MNVLNPFNAPFLCVYASLIKYHSGDYKIIINFIAYVHRVAAEMTELNNSTQFGSNEPG